MYSKGPCIGDLESSLWSFWKLTELEKEIRLCRVCSSQLWSEKCPPAPSPVGLHIWTIGPWLVVLFGKVVEPLRGGAFLGVSMTVEWTFHCQQPCPTSNSYFLPFCGWDVVSPPSVVEMFYLCLLLRPPSAMPSLSWWALLLKSWVQMNSFFLKLPLIMIFSHYSGKIIQWEFGGYELFLLFSSQNLWQELPLLCAVNMTYYLALSPKTIGRPIHQTLKPSNL